MNLMKFKQRRSNNVGEYAYPLVLPLRSLLSSTLVLGLKFICCCFNSFLTLWIGSEGWCVHVWHAHAMDLDELVSKP